MTGIRQDDVDFSTTAAMLFDYEAIGMVPTAGTATVEILFTSMGTKTLWSKSYPTGTVNQQIRDERAMIDMPPTRGRLTIQVSVAPGSGNQVTRLDFRIDNLRMQ